MRGGTAPLPVSKLSLSAHQMRFVTWLTGHIAQQCLTGSHCPPDLPCANDKTQWQRAEPSMKVSLACISAHCPWLCHRTLGGLSSSSSRPTQAGQHRRPQQVHAAQLTLAQQRAGAAYGMERELVRVRVHSQNRPAPRRPVSDAETERIAQIMASHRAQPCASSAAPSEA